MTKNKLVAFRLTQNEYDQLQQLSPHWGMSKQIRVFVLNGIKEARKSSSALAVENSRTATKSQ